MTVISRRKTIKYLAALPIASALSCRSWLQNKNSAVPKASAANAKWNILLHGQFVIQWTSPADPSLMRLIFPTVIAGVGLLIPLTAGMDAMRQLLFPRQAHGLLSVDAEIGLLVGLAAVFLALARRCLSYLERKAREEGSLSVRWQ